METYRIWEGTRTWLPGDTGYKITEIVGEEIGMLEDVNPDGFSGNTYYVYRTENEIVIHLVRWVSGIGEPHYGSIHRYRNLEEAAQSEFRDTLKMMRII